MRELVGPVDQPPRFVESLHRSIGMTQLVDEALEDPVVVEEQHAGFVVDLESDHGGVAGVAGDDLADDPSRRRT